MRVPREAKKQKETTLSKNEAWRGQHRVMVMAEQPTNQWAVQEGHPQQAKSSWRGKNGKFYHNRQYKKALTVHNKWGGGGRKKE